MQHLFPEAANHEFEIASAKIQIVNGYNLQLIIKVEPTLIFKMTMYVPRDLKVRITSVERPIGTRPMLGAYRWQNPDNFSDNQMNEMINLIQKQNNVLVTAPKVMAYRTKIVNGLKQHVILTDSLGKVMSAEMILPSGELHSTLESFYIIE
ncbi:hypothetical protein TRFO_39491 [Tritrichomonas foetus]|uniref:Uncharacterized protein n=1 Tax=Tritrichomonas foetus TaxID=1144522 RepID=A0A1J4JA29_9EUKA|nr:hypothetical protein TRFO_39491 [Tritrichomonas foetus]|eukprot:OHS94301.1 hypothetical protein TRFO_39491 [Tritrichomonas foetus]